MIIDIIEKVSENEEAMIVRPADTKDLAVITSYSIHYTKLYDLNVTMSIILLK